ncbi:ion channel [Desulfosporosinus sp. FKB]|uniref:ion channel n=1 Tax=Desulfosporosinus sp. FKB TaxID=1969835 RepID=UPI000B49A968|nr:ion channel [Desulfosporosinus sp. FKB]
MVLLNSIQYHLLIILIYGFVLIPTIFFLKSNIRKTNLKFLKEIFTKPYKDLWNDVLFLKVFYIVLLVFFILTVLVTAYIKILDTFGVLTHFKTIIYTFLLSAFTMLLLFIMITIILSSLKWFLDYILGNNSWQILSYAFIIPLILITFLLVINLNNVHLKSLIFPFAVGLGFSHIIVIRGLLLISSKTYLLFPKPNNKQVYKWYAKYVGMFVWFVTIIQILYAEVLLIWKIDPNSFGPEGTINLRRLVYFVVVTFTTVGGDITPTDKLGRLATMGITLTSIIFLIIFVSTILPIQGFPTENNDSSDHSIKEN